MPPTKILTPELRQAFIELIVDQTGIFIRPIDYNSLEEKLNQQIKANRLTSGSSYYDLLSRTDQKAQLEWQKFVQLLTNNESYFFRDQNQFKLLKEKIIPDLIQKQKTEKTLRICSAGCSTGEEPYSLAILLKELIPNAKDWHISVIGIDIDRTALAKARTGIYNPWSFRKVANSVKNKYFEESNNQYAIKSEFKDLVKFMPINLSSDALLSKTKLTNLDLLICRNVFIYFQADTVAKILDNFWHLLKPNGYLITGHAELHNQNLSKFDTKIFSESIVYQKSIVSTNKQSIESNNLVDDSGSTRLNKLDQLLNRSINLTSRIDNHTKLNSLNKNHFNSNKSAINTNSVKYTDNISNQRQPQPDSQLDPNLILDKIELLIEQKKYSLALKKLNRLEAIPDTQFKVNCIQAKINANLGEYDRAREYAQQAIAVNNLNIEPYYTLAQIAIETEDFSEAKKLYKKIAYLEPNCISAYWELSTIYESEKDWKRSKKLLTSSLNLLIQLDAEKIILPYDLTASQLIAKIQEKLDSYHE